jgi:putative IMPACT (imprinted ancient) family translation regulator
VATSLKKRRTFISIAFWSQNSNWLLINEEYRKQSSIRNARNRSQDWLKSRKKYAKATHNSWAARLTHQGAVYETKNDDGETGAGMVILRTMQKEDITDCIICVTRWFGGVKLMGDRFKHVQDATKIAIERM